MLVVAFFVLMPLLVSALLLFIRKNKSRKLVAGIAGLILSIGGLVSSLLYFGAPWVQISLSSVLITYIGLVIDVLLALVILNLSMKNHQRIVMVCALVYLVAILIYGMSFAFSATVDQSLYIDSLNIPLIFVLSVVASLAACLSLHFEGARAKNEKEDSLPATDSAVKTEKTTSSKDDEANEKAKDLGPEPSVVPSLIFLLITAVAIVLFSNNLNWLFSGFNLLGLTLFGIFYCAEDSPRHTLAFKMIGSLLIGFLCFVAGLAYIGFNLKTLSLLAFLQYGLQNPSILLFSTTCFLILAFAASAFFPFSSWAKSPQDMHGAELSASYAVSFSAGLFLIIKLAPILTSSYLGGLLVILVAGTTCLVSLAEALTETSIIGRVELSFSACISTAAALCGVGAPETIWPATAILFTSVPAAGLLMAYQDLGNAFYLKKVNKEKVTQKKTANFLERERLIGLIGLNIAPVIFVFAKWSTISYLLESSHLGLVLVLAFAAALFLILSAHEFICTIEHKMDGYPQETLSRPESFFFKLLTALEIFCSVFIPLFSAIYLMPYVLSVFGQSQTLVTSDLLWLAFLFAFLVIIAFFAKPPQQFKDKFEQKEKFSPYLFGSAYRTEYFESGKLEQAVVDASSNSSISLFFNAQRISTAATVLMGILVCIFLALAILIGFTG
ncbi:MAG: hypothetical protein ACOYCA_04415 [Eggerthellaceae bacterium]